MAATLLGGMPHPASTAALIRSLWEDEFLALASALALADQQPVWALPALLHRSETAESIAVRTACAGGCLSLGHRPSAAFLIDVLGANLPGRQASDQRSALPRRERWAFERELALHALEARSGSRFGYDPNASVPDLLHAVGRWETWAAELRAGESLAPMPAELVDVLARLRELTRTSGNRDQVDAALRLLEQLDPEDRRR